MKKMAIYILCFVMCVWTVAASASVTIAVITPKAGVHARQGEEIFTGVQHAVDGINAAGGLLKQKVKILPIDDQCSNNIAISTAQMLTLSKQQNPVLVIGPYCQNAFADVTDTYSRAGMLQIIPTAISVALKNVKHKGLIKMLGYSSQQAKDFFAYYNKHLAGEKVALIHNPDDKESLAIAEAIRDEFQTHGKSILLQNYTYDDEGNDGKVKYDVLAAKIVAQGNKIAFVTGTEKNIRKMARYLKSERASFMIFTDRYTASEKYFDYLGDDADGTYFMSLNGQINEPDLAEEMVQLRLSGFEPEGLALYGYSAVKIWEQLVKKAGSFDYAKVSKKINNNKIETTLGSYYFSGGEPKQSEKYIVQRYHNGTLEKID